MGFFFFFFSHIFNISVCFFLLNIYTITQRFEVHRFFFTELPLFSRKRIPFVFLAKHRFEIFFEKSGFYHNVWGCFFLEKKENRDMMAQTINNHQIRVVICTVFFFSSRGWRKMRARKRRDIKTLIYRSFLFSIMGGQLY